MDALPAFAQLPRRFVDHLPWRYEGIRPLGLFEDRPATQRAAETHPHPEPVRKLARRFEHQGLLGLLPEHTEVTRARPGPPSPASVVAALTRLKALSQGFGYREWARILHDTCHEHLDDKTVKKLWHQSPLPLQGDLPCGLAPPQPARSQTRRQVIHLYAQGWSKGSIRAFLHGSRPTVTLWMHRFAAEHWSGLEDKSRAPTAPVRKVWLPLRMEG